MLPGMGVVPTVQRVVVDQFCFAPLFIPTFVSVLTILEGHTNPATIFEKVQAGWWPALKGNWVIWIPAQAVNFSIVPPQFQVLFANVVGLAFNCYLSFVVHSTSTEAAISGDAALEISDAAAA